MSATHHSGGTPPIPLPISQPIPTDGDHQPMAPADGLGQTMAAVQDERFRQPAWVNYWRNLRILSQGCWLVKFTPQSPSFFVPYQFGTIRVERDGTNTVAQR